MSRIKKILTAGLLSAVLISLGVISFWLPMQHVVPIIMYHHVTRGAEDNDLNSVRPEIFERQMKYLKDHGFEVVSLEKLVHAMQTGRKISRKSVVITFDDGYDDNYTQGYPVLKKYGFPASVFIPTDFIGETGYLSWPQIKEMAANQITFGSHSVQHIYLPDLPPDRQREEIVQSKRVLEKGLGRSVDYFAYPIGGFSPAIKAMTKDAGYKAALTTNRGYDRLNKDRFELNRVRFNSKDNRPDYLWIKLSGYYNLFREPKDPY